LISRQWETAALRQIRSHLSLRHSQSPDNLNSEEDQLLNKLEAGEMFKQYISNKFPCK